MDKEKIVIDGAMGEGGGQVLRAALALSMATGQPFHMENIRANRPKPGLKRQHLACVQAAQTICEAKVTGNSINSTAISFTPGKVKAGDYHFDIGSGGSCTLVLQGIVPPLLLASGPSRITVTGGTHVPHAPTFEFLQCTLLPWLEKLGPKLSACMKRPGFMQTGGGSITVEIQPTAKLQHLDAQAAGDLLETKARILCHNLEPHIAQRECVALQDETLRDLGLLPENIEEDKRPIPDIGAGNAVLISLRHEFGTTVCSGIGQRGLAAESVVRQAAQRARTFMRAGVPVDMHLADQLLVPLALGQGGVFSTEKPSLHTRTCLEVLSMFTKAQSKITQLSAKSWQIAVVL